MSDKMPLSLVIESAKSKLTSSLNEIIAETKLPAFLLEGVIHELLSDLRKQKSLELMSDYATMLSKEKEE